MHSPEPEPEPAHAALSSGTSAQQSHTVRDHAVRAYMESVVASCGTVKDPLSDVALDISEQCVNVSLSQDDLTEVTVPPLRTIA